MDNFYRAKRTDNGNGFTVIGNIYDNQEFAEAARHNIA